MFVDGPHHWGRTYAAGRGEKSYVVSGHPFAFALWPVQRSRDRVQTYGCVRAAIGPAAHDIAAPDLTSIRVGGP